MRKAAGRDPYDRQAIASPLEIEIDPSLIEEALASVDRAGRRSRGDAPEAPADPSPEEVVVEVPIEAAEKPRDVVAGDDERRRLTVRIRDQAEAIRRLEEALARVTEIRDGLDTQVRDLRKLTKAQELESAAAFQRSRKDRDEAERLAEERTIRGLLDIVDNVERALVHADSAEPAKILAGLNMIAEQFRGALRKLNVERVPAAPGSTFDPGMHEAVLHLPTGEVAPGCIVNEVAAGFILRGRLVRAARVVVASVVPAPFAEPE